MKITWIGHSAIKIIFNEKVIFIDPFISGNPSTTLDPNSIEKAEIVLVSHDHSDHIGDSFNICKNTGATLISTFEIAQAASEEGIATEQMNVGGTVKVDDILISMVPAFHTGGLGGTAVGFILKLGNQTIYYAGDTGLTIEMKMISEVYKPDLALLPIDGRFTMTVELAAKAVEYLKVKKAIPIHYNTFPIIQSSPEKFKELCKNYCFVTILKPGESMDI
jgi:L-ascorbate metabolism protein UlaG (beta-lactamase superfamily)